MWKRKKNKGHFITIEGGEGAGKSTLIQALSRHLLDRGESTCVTHAPGGTPLGQSIRDLLLNPRWGGLHPLTELHLFLADRSQQTHEVILPALARGDWVLCDRFHDSTIAYQGVRDPESLPHVKELCHRASQGILPDLTLIIDIDPEVGLARGGRLDRVEKQSIEFHHKVREVYRHLAKGKDRQYLLLDGNQSADSLLKDAIRALNDVR
ncbi:MAG: dTMP kinase [Chlamydiota bacterium]|nr:dTMP kinase [Chlamydiota bacterium]